MTLLFVHVNMKSRVVSDIVLSPYKRKSALFQARSTLQGIQNLAAFAPVPGLVACVPIVVSIIDSVDVSFISDLPVLIHVTLCLGRKI